MKQLEGLRVYDIVSFFCIRLINCFSYLYGTIIFLVECLIFGVKLSGRVDCWGVVYLLRYPRSEIRIGKNVSMISSSIRCTATSVFAPVRLRTMSRTASIIVGDNVGFSGTSIVARSKKIYIGSGTMIAPNVVIMDSDFHGMWPPENRAYNPSIEEDRDVNIGCNVWIGTQAIILKGVTIGDNSVIAAGSVVTSEMPSNVLAAGVPAKVVRYIGKRGEM